MGQDYEINSSTLLLVAINDKKTIIYDKDSETKINKRSSKIIDESCKFFGSSLIGRQEGTKDMIGITIKVPIIIEESRNIIFFPTSSPRNHLCSWISYNNLLKYVKIDKFKTRLYFVGGKEIDIDVSYNIVDNQITRCIKLEKTLLSRKKAI